MEGEEVEGENWRRRRSKVQGEGGGVKHER